MDQHRSPTSRPVVRGHTAPSPEEVRRGTRMENLLAPLGEMTLRGSPPGRRQASSTLPPSTQASSSRASARPHNPIADDDWEMVIASDVNATESSGADGAPWAAGKTPPGIVATLHWREDDPKRWVIDFLGPRCYAFEEAPAAGHTYLVFHPGSTFYYRLPCFRHDGHRWFFRTRREDAGSIEHFQDQAMAILEKIRNRVQAHVLKACDAVNWVAMPEFHWTWSTAWTCEDPSEAIIKVIHNKPARTDR